MCMLWIRTVKTSQMNETSYSREKKKEKRKKFPFCCSHGGLSRCSCTHSSVVILLYLTDIATQAEAFGKDLYRSLQEKKG